MWTHLRGRTILTFALASALCAFGCGDDDDDTPTTPDVPAPIESPTPAPSPSTSPTPAPSPTPGTNPGESVVFVGKINEINPPFLRVSQQEVVTDETTVFERNGEPITLTGLQVQEIIRVKGVIQDNEGTILATKIVVVPPAE